LSRHTWLPSRTDAAPWRSRPALTCAPHCRHPTPPRPAPPTPSRPARTVTICMQGVCPPPLTIHVANERLPERALPKTMQVGEHDAH
jgi:hypothetical protein